MSELIGHMGYRSAKAEVDGALYAGRYSSTIPVDR